jgi:predicted negative regulator of RcsB-dependent stress response
VSERVEQMEKILKERGMEILFARVASNLLNKGNVDEAINICENGLKKFPAYAHAHYVLASCYLNKKRPNEAKNEFERTLKLDPGHLRARKKLTDLYHELGMEDAFKQNLQRLNYLDPLNREITQRVTELGISMPWPIEEPVEKERASEIQKIEKVDLSQFDNRKDDFISIISGKHMETGEAGSAGTGSANGEEAGTDEDGQPIDYEDLDELKFEDSGNPIEKKDGQWIRRDANDEATEIIISMNKTGREQRNLDDRSKTEQDRDSDNDGNKESSQPKIVSQTLGEILVSQKKYTQALKVFELLQEQHPDNRGLEKKISFLKKIISLEQKQ